LAINLKLPLSELSQIPPELLLTKDSETNSKIWTTSLVIAFVMKQFASLKLEWELVMNKSKSWIDKQLAETSAAGLQSSSSSVKLIARAKEVLNTTRNTPLSLHSLIAQQQ